MDFYSISHWTHHISLGPGKLLMVGVRDFADLRPKIRQIYAPFLRI